MQLVLIGYVAFMAACGIVGGRLLFRGLRERLLPEGALGFGFLCSGCVGYLLAVLAAFVPDMSPELGRATNHVSNVVIDVGFLGLLTFMLLVFGAGRPLVTAVAVGTGAALLTGLAMSLTVGSEPGSAAFWIHFVARTFAFGLVGFEGSRQASRMRRRLALGLADPVVANRFALFAAFGFSAAAMSIVVSIGLALFSAPGAPPIPPVALTASALGFASAVWMWLAFFPPTAYLEWVTRRAAPVTA
jgi:hypothetical protein